VQNPPTSLVFFFDLPFLLNFQAFLSKWSSKTPKKILCRKCFTKKMRKIPFVFFCICLVAFLDVFVKKNTHKYPKKHPPTYVSVCEDGPPRAVISFWVRGLLYGKRARSAAAPPLDGPPRI
jgi:hypothetical protein